MWKSYSKMGFGNGFTSKANRIVNRGRAAVNTGPGPGSYDHKLFN